MPVRHVLNLIDQDRTCGHVGQLRVVHFLGFPPKISKLRHRSTGHEATSGSARPTHLYAGRLRPRSRLLGGVPNHHAQVTRVLRSLRIAGLGRSKFLGLHGSPRFLVHSAGKVLPVLQSVLGSGTTLFEGFAVSFTGRFPGMGSESLHRVFLCHFGLLVFTSQPP